MTITWADYTNKTALVGKSDGTIVRESLSDIAPPPGMIVMWWGTGNIPPKGWKFCNGLNYPINGASVKVPNMAGRMPLGGGVNYDTTSFAVGKKTHTLTLNELPPHSHPYERHNMNPGNKCDVVGADYNAPDAVPAWKKTLNTGSAGSGAAHNNMPPYHVVRFIIKVDE